MTDEFQRIERAFMLRVAWVFLVLFLFLVATSAFFQVLDRHEKFYCDRIQAAWDNAHPKGRP